MFTLELNGRKVEADNEKEARKALAKLAKEERKAAEKTQANNAIARLRAQASAYNAMTYKARSQADTLPRAWILYIPGDNYAKGLFHVAPDHTEFAPWKHVLCTQENSNLLFEHYGNDLIGCVCNGAGFVWAVVLRDRYAPQETKCYAIGVEADSWALAELYGIGPDDFRKPRSRGGDED